LSQKYNCHINVEIATSITAVKYLYKYVYKGHDRACVSVQVEDNQHTSRDEVREYLDMRYVSPSEACWRIYGFSLHRHSPAVTRLQLHLPNMQMVTFDPITTDANEIASRQELRRTTLTEFFQLCRAKPDETQTLLYPDCPRYYTWNKQKLQWTLRKTRTTGVGRIYFAPPTAGEQYYLRLLLYNVPGPTSYCDLRTYNDILYPTFQAACAARGLLATDDEWNICLEEAALFKTGHQLRQLFITILLMNEPLDPRALFERYVDFLSDDCRYLLQHHFNVPTPSDEQIQSLTLYKLQILLEKSGKSLQDYNLPLPTIDFDDLNGMPRLIAQEFSYDCELLRAKWANGYRSANPGQRQALDSVVYCLSRNLSNLFFVDGPGGTGKTFIENLLLAYARSLGEIALAVASSGIASLLLDGGRTSHSRFKIPIDIHSNSQCTIPAQSQLAELIRMTRLIIWDEAPAQHRYCFQAVDTTFKDIRQSAEWFGGITIVFSGIFLLS
jgi:hypothetical protein